MHGVPTPNYIKNVTFTNNSAEAVKVTVKFQSTKVTEVSIQAGASQTISNQIDQGTFTTVDRIESADVVRTGENHANILHFDSSNVHGIECRNYIITPTFQALGIQKLN